MSKEEFKSLEDGLYAKMTTNHGAMTIKLYEEEAPMTVANFVGLAEGTKENKAKSKGVPFYDGIVFHRVIKDFMIQGGGMNAQMQEKQTREPIPLEAKNGLKNQRGTIAMARTNMPDSATAQFFINVKDNDFLNAAPGNDGYAVFGKVVQGMDVVDKIRAVATGSAGMHQDVPNQAIVIKEAVLLPAKTEKAAKADNAAAQKPAVKADAKAAVKKQ